MVTRAYGYCRVSNHEVRQRLHMGDSHPNRVLHLAVREGKLVGCCSSTLQTPWCPSGCGHWGLLSVDPAAQGTGVASALVAAAEQRLYEAGLREVQIEYDYHRGDPQSERLLAWYEGSCGFTGPGSRHSGFRRCRKRLRAAPRPSEGGHPSRAKAWASTPERTPLVTAAGEAAPASETGGENRAVKRRRSSFGKGCSGAIVARLRAALSGCSPKSARATQ